MIEEVIKDNTNNVIIAKIYRNSVWPDNLNFYTKDEDFVQVSTWNYNQGKHLKAHKHKVAERMSNRTQEVVFVKSGKMSASFFTDTNEFIDKIIVSAGDFLIIFSGGHSYDILEDKTQILEIKNGPYLGLEKDKELIED